MARPSYLPATYAIASPRLVIRTAETSDAEALLRFYTTAENFPLHGAQTGLTADKVRARVGRWKESQAQGRNAFLVVALRDTGEVIGTGGLNCFETEDGRPVVDAADDDVVVVVPAQSGDQQQQQQQQQQQKPGPYLTDTGAMLDHRYWRRGYATEAVCATVEYAIGELGCRVVRIETAADNEPWRALMRSLGLDRLEVRGSLSYDDTAVGWVYKITPEDWKAAKSHLIEIGKWPL